MWIYINNLDQVIWLAEIRSGHGILIYSAGQGLKFQGNPINKSGDMVEQTFNIIGIINP